MSHTLVCIPLHMQWHRTKIQNVHEMQLVFLDVNFLDQNTLFDQTKLKIYNICLAFVSRFSQMKIPQHNRVKMMLHLRPNIILSSEIPLRRPFTCTHWKSFFFTILKAGSWSFATWQCRELLSSEFTHCQMGTDNILAFKFTVHCFSFEIHKNPVYGTIHKILIH